MVELVKGNILEADAEALVNTVNTVGIMGKGIALQFRQAFPGIYEIYRRACQRGEVVPGKMFVVSTDRLTNPKYIINFPTKRHWKHRSRLTDIEDGLVDLLKVIRETRIQSIAIPPLGCGSGGLDWNAVRPRILQALAAMPETRVLLYSPEGAPEVEAMPVATKPPRMNHNRAALLALMLNYGIPGYRLTLLEIQKLAYFLQLAGQPLRLSFVKHKYGPYAEALNHVLQRLEGHFIRGYGDRSREASVRVLPEAGQQAVGLLADDTATLERIRRVTELIEGFETPHGMELLSTVHWIAEEDPRAKEDPALAVRLVHSWSPRKVKMFPPRHVLAAHRQLGELAWF
jgi:O-acetyl-ADP-ribose deacetylase (regulator of RNase III)